MSASAFAQGRESQQSTTTNIYCFKQKNDTGKMAAIHIMYFLAVSETQTNFLGITLLMCEDTHDLVTDIVPNCIHSHSVKGCVDDNMLQNERKMQ